MTDSATSASGSDRDAPKSDFIRDAVQEDLRSGRFDRVRTRWPPEPNGYLHIGHAKAICIDFGIAESFGGKCNLRFDDTNPTKEEQEYVDSIKEDTRWLGFDWEDREYFASDYFEQLYQWAEKLIRDGKAYVCDLSEQEIREYRGTDVTDKGPRHRHSAGTGQPLPKPVRRGEPGSVPPDAGRGVPRRGPDAPGRASTWPTPTCTCGTR